MQRIDTRECRKDSRDDLRHEEFQYRRGFATGVQVALGIVGRGAKQGRSFRETMEAANLFLYDVKNWRDHHPDFCKAPKAPLPYPAEGQSGPADDENGG